MNSMSLMLIAMILAMFVMTSFSMKKQKKNMEDVRAWRENLKEGDEVATHSGLLGKVVSIDIPHEEGTAKKNRTTTANNTAKKPSRMPNKKTLAAILIRKPQKNPKKRIQKIFKSKAQT